MTMKWLAFSGAACVVAGTSAAVPDTVWIERTDTVWVSPSDTVRTAYMRRVSNYNRAWHALIPKGSRIQYAGNMGAFSVGPIWQYGRNHQWETALQLGLIPRHGNGRAIVALTLKEDFVPWSVNLGRRFSFQPLATGLYLTTVFDSRFWTAQPGRYPKGYYWFATRVRTNVYLGQRISLDIPESRRFLAKRVSVFYEVSASDYSVIERIGNSSLKPSQYLSLSFGLQFEWF